MAYTLKKFVLEKPTLAFRFLMDTFEIRMGEAQKMIDKRRVFVEGEQLLKKSTVIVGNISVVVFEGESRGLAPVFETEDFAVFEKPSGVMMHPRKRSDGYTLNDEIKSLYGNDANAAHRIDKSTSGLVLVGKHKQAEIELKRLFATRQVQKSYLALVHGKMDDVLMIDEKLKRDVETSQIRLKVHVDERGKFSQTKITPLHYFKDKNATLVEAIPYTGRQHQIRVHLFHVKHHIVGDPIYGVEEEDAERFLDGTMCLDEQITLTHSSRLLLHAQTLAFEYKGIFYKIASQFDAKIEFYTLMKG
ncbi:RluA family pseudouridine synthase [Sulfurospirillum multivorans]|uniref:RNA pseudouridylate synthase n=2 Tax=Sulfurospirillum multivorans TaxID=66821 RepID=A0AA86AIY1_SULMK|nr:RluA family pseudouridine synthase [Sulfurospirillum multivorans]AHJ11394.1 putative RNA pseudouridine synthase [Sulfurospirillum multivorans DSM 12446]QEH04898.1 putative RNA pseudouridine synthase [Sulfurospirillum multivorans]